MKRAYMCQPSEHQRSFIAAETIQEARFKFGCDSCKRDCKKPVYKGLWKVFVCQRYLRNAVTDYSKQRAFSDMFCNTCPEYAEERPSKRCRGPVVKEFCK